MRRIFFLLLVLLLLGLIGVGAGLAQSGNGYDLSWWTADGGGGVSSGGGYALAGTTGQPDAGDMAGGAFSLSGGFWTGVTAGSSPTAVALYLPMVIKSP